MKNLVLAYEEFIFNLCTWKDDAHHNRRVSFGQPLCATSLCSVPELHRDAVVGSLAQRGLERVPPLASRTQD